MYMQFRGFRSGPKRRYESLFAVGFVGSTFSTSHHVLTECEVYSVEIYTKDFTLHMYMCVNLYRRLIVPRYRYLMWVLTDTRAATH